MSRKESWSICATVVVAFTIGFASTDAHAVDVGGKSFPTWGAYFASPQFQANGRCGKPASVITAAHRRDASDCTYVLTNPSATYGPGDVYQIPVVVHIIEHTNGDGQISDAMVNSQIDVLNEDFQALAGTPGAPGFDVQLQFVLASTDPMGNPTTGITRSVNDTWFNDNGSYWNTLAWDTSKYMNVYTNLAGGNLGYVPDLPQGGLAGDPADRVVVLWSAFGRNAPAGPPYDQGRTLTHEVGHYLGLEHTFNSGCGTSSMPGCYSTGDLICDTNAEANETSGCPGGKSSCGSSDPIDNYMDYSDDTCMDKFTAEQSNRMRCSLINYRPDLYTLVNPGVCGDDVQNTGEDCDGTDDAACTGLCQVDCTCPPPVCGNDVLEAGEECDGTDDAACPGQCIGAGLNECTCPSTCGDGTCDPGEDAASCGLDCGCQSNSCGDQAPDGCWCDELCFESGDCCPDVCAGCSIHCEADPTCGATPETGCLVTQADKSRLIIKDDVNDARDKLIWKWRKGEETAIADFLSPTTNPASRYSLCLYDSSGGSQPVMATAVPGATQCGGRDCWRMLGGVGFRYKDRDQSPSGVKILQMKSGANGKSIALTKAGGAELPLPSLPLSFPLTMQLIADDGSSRTCFETQFSAPIRNDVDQVKAKGP